MTTKMRRPRFILILFVYLSLTSCQKGARPIDEEKDFAINVEHSDFDAEYEEMKSLLIASKNKPDYDFIPNPKTKEDIDSILTEEFKDRKFIEIIVYTALSGLNDTIKLSWNKTGMLDKPKDTVLYNTRLFWRDGNKTIKISKSEIRGNFQLSANNKHIITFDIPRHYNFIKISRVWSHVFIIRYDYKQPIIED
jgi:hypothetical protein